MRGRDRFPQRITETTSQGARAVAQRAIRVRFLARLMAHPPPGLLGAIFESRARNKPAERLGVLSKSEQASARKGARNVVREVRGQETVARGWTGGGPSLSTEPLRGGDLRAPTAGFNPESKPTRDHQRGRQRRGPQGEAWENPGLDMPRGLGRVLPHARKLPNLAGGGVKEQKFPVLAGPRTPLPDPDLRTRAGPAPVGAPRVNCRRSGPGRRRACAVGRRGAWRSP